MHGHYLDCHNDVRTFECLARALVERVTRTPKNGYTTPDDYEAVLAPVYNAIYRVAQSRRARHAARLGKAAVRWWERLNGYRGPRRRPGWTRWRKSWIGSASTQTMCSSATSTMPGRGRPRAGRCRSTPEAGSTPTVPTGRALALLRENSPPELRHLL